MGFLGSKDSSRALAPSCAPSDATAAAASALAFFSCPVAWYARARETSASTFFGAILSARVASATTSAQCRSARWHWDFAAKRSAAPGLDAPTSSMHCWYAEAALAKLRASLSFCASSVLGG